MQIDSLSRYFNVILGALVRCRLYFAILPAMVRENYDAMKKWQIILGVGAVVATLAASWILYARSGGLNADPGATSARYGGPPSQYIDIDGTRIHFKDEGNGDVIVLMHGSRANLAQWDGWVRELGDRYRIIRFDSLGHGLTGPDGRNDYSAARQLFLLDELTTRLGATRFFLGGTSSGATVAVRYAALHPQRVRALLLSTVPLRLPSVNRVGHFDGAVFWFHDKVLHSLGTDLYWRTFLRSIYGDPSKVDDEVATRYRMLNTLPGQQQRFEARLASWRKEGGADRDYALAAQVTAPILVQWGAAGPVIPSAMHREIAAAFRGAKVQVMSYPELGHKLVMEDPARTAGDAEKFLNGMNIPP